MPMASTPLGRAQQRQLFSRGAPMAVDLAAQRAGRLEGGRTRTARVASETSRLLWRYLTRTVLRDFYNTTYYVIVVVCSLDLRHYLADFWNSKGAW